MPSHQQWEKIDSLNNCPISFSWSFFSGCCCRLRDCSPVFPFSYLSDWIFRCCCCCGWMERRKKSFSSVNPTHHENCFVCGANAASGFRKEMWNVLAMTKLFSSRIAAYAHGDFVYWNSFFLLLPLPSFSIILLSFCAFAFIKVDKLQIGNLLLGKEL